MVCLREFWQGYSLDIVCRSSVPKMVTDLIIFVLVGIVIYTVIWIISLQRQLRESGISYTITNTRLDEKTSELERAEQRIKDLENSVAEEGGMRNRNLL